MKEFTICYTLDNEIIKELDVENDDVEQEIYKKLSSASTAYQVEGA